MSFEKNMQNGTQKTKNGWKHPFKQIQKIVVITLLLAGLSINAGFAKEGENQGLLTIFHIYSGGKYIGVLSDEAKLEKLKDEELKKAASEFANLPLIIGTDLSVIPERVFTAGTDDDIVLGKLQKMLSVKAEAVAITVDGELALYVKNMAAYDEVIQDLKLQSVTVQELNEFEARKASTKPIPPLKENETRITDIIMSGNVKANAGKTAPDNIKTVEEAVVVLKKGTLEEKKYVVKSGDILGNIANSHNMATAKLLEINPGITSETIIKPGDELSVTIIEPLLEVEVHYESKQTKIINYNNLTEQDSSLYKGDKKITQKGSDGEKEVIELIRKRNGQIVGSSVLEEKIITKPKDQVTVVGTKVMPSRGTGSFKWPTVGGYVSSHMGKRWGAHHRGIDIARPSSRTIMAADNGVVTFAGRQGSYGNKVVINHKNGYETVYAHLASINVKVGQTVQQGKKIGVMGSTGRSTGVHLHFEVTKNGSLVNPLNVLR